MSHSVIAESKIVAGHSLVYGLGNLLNRAVAFVMLPVYTRYLSPSDYGILEITAISIQVLSIVASAGLSQAIMRFYFEYDDSSKRNLVLSTGIESFAVLSLAVIIPLLCFSEDLSSLLLGSKEFGRLFFVGLSSVWFGTLSEIGFLHLRILKKSYRFMILSALKLVLSLSLNIYFIVFAEMGVIGILYSTLITSGVFSALLLFPLFRDTGLRFSRPVFIQMLRFGLPLVPQAISQLVVLSSDRYFLRFLTSFSETGIYSLACRFAVIPGEFVSYPFMQIWSVRRLEIYKEENSERVMGRVFSYFCAFLIAAGLGVAVLARDAIIIMAQSAFWDAYRLVPLLILAQMFLSFFQHVNFGLIIAKKTKYFAYVDGACCILSLFLNYVLIRAYGVIGAALTALVCFSVRALAVYLISIPFYRIHFEFLRVAKMLGCGLAVYSLSLLVPGGPLYASVGAKLVLICVLFPLFLMVLRTFERKEIEFLKAKVLRGRFGCLVK